MKKSKAFTAAVMATMFVVPVFAKDHGDNGEGRSHGKGRDRHEERAERREDVREGAYFTERHREEARHYYVEHYGDRKGCPPGLAKKNNGCMPPGQARKWAVGQPVPAGVVVYSVPQPVLTVLPPAPVGYRYERLGADIVLVRVSGNVVVDVMLNIF